MTAQKWAVFVCEYSFRINVLLHKKLKQYRILCKVDKKEMYQWIL